MRIGFVGLSTPLFYDYRYQASVAPSDVSDSPNPILEGAFGALLFYDELWFLCRSLCPENMRALNYVKFLDEMGMVPEVDPERLPDPVQVFDAKAIEAFDKSSKDYYAAKSGANIYWDAAADNHTHGLKVGDIQMSGNSWNIKNVVFDLLLTERLEKVELITNSFSSRLFKTEASVRNRLLLSEIIVIESVPQYLTPSGPYHPCMDEVRYSSYLSDFRRWIQTEAAEASLKEIHKIKREVETQLAESQRQIFLKYLDPKTGYTSLAETVVGIGLDALVPGVGAVTSLVGQLSEEKRKQGLRWQGFIMEARAKLKDITIAPIGP